MKLSSFFVAAMVVASVNAGLIDKSKVEDIAPQTTEPSLSSASHAMLALVRKQKEDYPILEHIFNNDPSHNSLLIVLFGLQKKILGLAGQIESESPAISAKRNQLEVSTLTTSITKRLRGC
ncbi:hypothetical protein BASA50_001670 [Batrachochytrium salamandrivorans]|uniref:Uncharacterized protein n=1 Tax=Batrachochytrium salamandrivorans TaxID=1357716 RepID=A0ABQ8FPT2_9FUNG|nr:hypothetical protein BASA50_001670 [Batrachochytrium salamandrivorans]